MVANAAPLPLRSRISFLNGARVLNRTRREGSKVSTTEARAERTSVIWVALFMGSRCRPVAGQIEMWLWQCCRPLVAKVAV